jgi:anti-anti-sigma factor
VKKGANEMDIQTRMKGDVAVFDLYGSLDGGPQSRMIHTEVKKALQEGRKKLVLNMGSIAWANTLGIGVLIASFVSSKREDAELKIFAVSERVAMTMKMMRLIPEIFEEFHSEEEAISSFS